MAFYKKTDLSPEQIEWLRSAYELKVHPSLMALHFGLHIDTIKKLLDRYDIAPALSPKHIATRPPKTDTWTRPCMKCKSTDPRPINQYVCTACKYDNSSETSGLPDNYLLY